MVNKTFFLHNKLLPGCQRNDDFDRDYNPPSDYENYCSSSSDETDNDETDIDETDSEADDNNERLLYKIPRPCPAVTLVNAVLIVYHQLKNEIHATDDHTTFVQHLQDIMKTINEILDKKHEMED